ncbi:hypothetical protein B0H13DRAFT_1856018 [Mycena leptocephala]|nr:hypothetical protein B0H13DRAFT_1856018 [Mycena leptocephala]
MCKLLALYLNNYKVDPFSSRYGLNGVGIIVIVTSISQGQRRQRFPFRGHLAPTAQEARLPFRSVYKDRRFLLVNIKSAEKKWAELVKDDSQNIPDPPGSLLILYLLVNENSAPDFGSLLDLLTFDSDSECGCEGGVDADISDDGGGSTINIHDHTLGNERRVWSASGSKWPNGTPYDTPDVQASYFWPQFLRRPEPFWINLSSDSDTIQIQGVERSVKMVLGSFSHEWLLFLIVLFWGENDLGNNRQRVVLKKAGHSITAKFGKGFSENPGFPLDSPLIDKNSFTIGLWIGKVPEDLKDLMFLEEQCIARARATRSRFVHTGKYAMVLYEFESLYLHGPGSLRYVIGYPNLKQHRAYSPPQWGMSKLCSMPIMAHPHQHRVEPPQTFMASNKLPGEKVSLQNPLLSYTDSNSQTQGHSLQVH